MQTRKTFDDWAVAHRELAEAEIDVLRWQLHEQGPVPQDLIERRAALQDRVDVLFELASVRLSSPYDTGQGEL